MEISKQSFIDRVYNPIFQALLTFGAVILFTIGGAFVKATGLIEVSERFPWMTAAAFMLFFAMFNSIFALFTKSMNKYWGRSIYSFVGLAAMSGFTAYLASSISINEAGSYRWIYIVVTVGYLVFLSMVTFMRTIVEFAQKEEWNQPRIRQKRRKNDRDRHIK